MVFVSGDGGKSPEKSLNGVELSGMGCLDSFDKEDEQTGIMIVDEDDEGNGVPGHVGHHHGHEKLGLVSLSVLAFYAVSGGPFGVEATVRSAGHFYTLCGFVIAPLIWSLQEAAMTAELGAALPDSAGGVAWVETAFGSEAGWMAGYLGWVSGATDNAIYPVLFMDYLLEAFWVDEGDDASSVHPMLRFVLLAMTSISLAYCNWLGLATVGKMAIVICMIAMSPFVILSIVGAFKIDPSRWFLLPTTPTTNVTTNDGNSDEGFIPNFTWGGIMWRPFLNNLFWNLNSFDAVSSLSADVEDPGRVFPKAMFIALSMTVVGYLIPLLVAMGASDAPQEAWVDGYFARVASDIVGPWLGAWTVFAAGISNIAMFQAELSADAFQLMGMAEKGFVPKIFATRSAQGTPTYGLMLGTAVIVVMGVSHLERLIEMLNFNYSLACMMEYCAFIKLRISRPDMHRPFRVPLGTFGCCVALTPTFIMTFVIFGMASKITWLFVVVANTIGIVAFRMKERNMCNCAPCCPKQYSTVDYTDADADSDGSDSPGISMLNTATSSLKSDSSTISNSSSPRQRGASLT